MDHFAGLDVSVKETSVCIVDGAGGRDWRIAQALAYPNEGDTRCTHRGNPRQLFPGGRKPAQRRDDLQGKSDQAVVQAGGSPTGITGPDLQSRSTKLLSLMNRL